MNHGSDQSFQFHVLARDGAARRGEMRTAHGVVQTPAFMPVGTQGAVKSDHPSRSRGFGAGLGAEIILGNTYHLYLRPGDDLIARAGGLHRFIGWERPILTDSGGYQVFSLAERRRISEDGAEFQSHLDGSLHLLTPERATDIQAQLGSDIAMVLDECIATPATAEDGARVAMERSVRWAARARARLEAARRPGVGAGGHRDQPRPGAVRHRSGRHRLRLRTESVQATVEIGFEAYAIGGLSVGEPPEVTYDVVSHTAPQLPADRPRYLMGSGMPDDLIECVARGIDLFDCVLPTRNARNGQLLTRSGPISIKNARYAEDSSAPRSGVRLLYVPALFAGVFTAPLCRRRDGGGDAQHGAQPLLLP